MAKAWNKQSTQPGLCSFNLEALALAAVESGMGLPEALHAIAVEHRKRRRWHLHFTPTSSSWLNMIETWFSVLTRKALTNTSFTSVAELEARIDWWVSHWNDNPEPFVWTRTADEIIDKVTRGRATHDRITNTATHH